MLRCLNGHGLTDPVPLAIQTAPDRQRPVSTKRFVPPHAARMVVWSCQNVTFQPDLQDTNVDFDHFCVPQVFRKPVKKSYSGPVAV